MTKLFNERVDASVEYLQDHFNHQNGAEMCSKHELKEILTTCLELLKEDHDAKKPLLGPRDLV